jgi:hypothetical protein
MSRPFWTRRIRSALSIQSSTRLVWTQTASGVCRQPGINRSIAVSGQPHQRNQNLYPAPFVANAGFDPLAGML